MRGTFIQGVERLTHMCREATQRSQVIDEHLEAIRRIAAEAEAVQARARALETPSDQRESDER
jgi:hypothetical protein